jgi:protein TonB
VQAGRPLSLAAFLLADPPGEPSDPPPTAQLNLSFVEAVMFESSTFDSMGTIHTRSRNWMFATFGFNASILALLVAIPLLHPAMLPQIPNLIPVIAPPTPVEQPKPIEVQPSSTTLHAGTQLFVSPFTAPRIIPTGTPNSTTDVPPAIGPLNIGSGPVTGSRTGCDPFNCGSGPTVVQRGAPATARVSSGVMAGMLIRKVLPAYPAIARAMRMGGHVELQATISRGGTIENLRIMSGPAVFQQAALDAVKQWRYQPYLLNGQPVEVETTINVDFSMN